MFLLVLEFNAQVLKLCLFGLLFLYNILALNFLIGDVQLLLKELFQ